MVQTFNRDEQAFYMQIKDEKENVIIAYPLNISTHHRRLIHDIYQFNEDNVLCLALIKTINQEIIYCKDDTYLYPKDITNDLTFSRYLIDKGIISELQELEHLATDFYKLAIYEDNITRPILVWDYRYLNIITPEDKKRINLSETDIYQNVNATLVNDIYVMPITVRNRITELKLVNINNGRVHNMELRYPLSIDSFIMGTKGNRIAWFDNSELTQYLIDVRKREQVRKNNVLVYVNQKQHVIDPFRVRAERILFNQKEIDLFDRTHTFTNSGPFNYLYIDNQIIMIDNENFHLPTMIVKEAGLKAITYKLDEIYYIKGDTLYRHQWNGQRVPLIRWSEWNFNYENLYFIGD